MSKKPRDELDDPNKWRPVSCAVCKKCFLNVELERRGIIRCYFGGSNGGPYKGYEEGCSK